MEVQLLIVDDEMQIRRGIELGIPWKDFGITRVLTAEDSPGAITILEREKIQILITDIRMPGMTGLDLAEFSKKMNPDIHVIILSGYSEFDYAKKAINIGVVEYLIKPIKINELTGLIQKIMEEIQSRIQEDAQQRKGMLEQRLKACFDGAGESDENYERLLEEYTGCELNKNILCIVFGFDSRISNDISRSCEYAREQLINEEKNGKENTYLLSWGKKLVWFTLMDIRRSRDQVIFQMGNVLRRINGDLRKTDSCGISGGAAGIMPLKNLHLAVKAGEQLLNHRLYLGCSVLIDQKDVRKKSETMFTLGETGHLRLCIAGYRYAGAEKYIKKQFRNMSELKITSYDIVKGTCLNLMQILFHTLKSSGLDVEAVLEKNRQSILVIPDLLTLEQYQEWILNFYYLILTGVSSNKEQSLNRMVITALSYITVNYSDEITVDSISSYVNKSKNYFSYLFKKEMGISFTEYLNKYRVEEAKRLMETTVDLNAEIARKVGFRDEKYFSAVFKKLEGCSATEFRKKKGDYE